MKSLKLLVLLALTCGPGPLLAYENFSISPGLAIPDGILSGVRNDLTVSSSLQQLGSLQVRLNISGDFNGDLYVYLRHGNALSVLLDRPGRTANNLYGYDDSGFNITLNDSAANGDIHNYRNVTTPPLDSPLTGVWQPDGRDTSPLVVLDTDLRTEGLSVFNNMDPDGTWTLFLADAHSGGSSVLNSWELDISPVPEPAGLALLLVAGGMAALAARQAGRTRHQIR